MQIWLDRLKSMRTHRATWFAVFFGAIASTALACCVAYGPHPVSLIDEKAIIVWNPQQQMQHFIRQASFESKGKDFGFIVPTPTKPEVAKANASAFERLRAIAYPPTRGTGRAGGGLGGGFSGGVQVIDQYRVGDYLATILKGTDGASILGWLKQNHYTARPAMAPWLDHYAKQNWFFAALKFAREEDQRSPATSALRISFKTDKPFYPYKMPTDTWPAGHVRPLALYFIGPAKASAMYKSIAYLPWGARTVWSGKLPQSVIDPLAKELTLEPSEFPKDAVMTAFLNGKTQQGYDMDLTFGNALQAEEESDVRSGWGWAAFVALGLVALRLRRSR